MSGGLGVLSVSLRRWEALAPFGFLFHKKAGNNMGTLGEEGLLWREFVASTSKRSQQIVGC